MSQIRREVLNAFKRLHRTRQNLFTDDVRALDEARKQINEHFRKNKNETNEVEIRKMIVLANQVEEELRKNVIQAVEKEEGVFELRITEEKTRLDNVPFDPYAKIPAPRRKRGAQASGCCGDSANPVVGAQEAQQK